MHASLVALGLCTALAMAPLAAEGQGNGCTFPGKGVGVGGTPGKGGTPGTFPGGGAPGGSFPGGNCGDGNGKPTVSASEPLSLGLFGAALVAASALTRLRRRVERDPSE